MTLSNTLGTVIGAGVAIYAVDAMFGRRRGGYGGLRRGSRQSTSARLEGQSPYLKRYRVSWRTATKKGSKSTVKSRIVLAKSADAARNLIARDFGVPKSKSTVKNIGG